jgi:cell division cycle 14
MRIVRPGCVVGPQQVTCHFRTQNLSDMRIQQYMYLKQLEWSKWAAVEELHRATAAAEPVVVAPVTPPREPIELSATMTPVTPHRYGTKPVLAANAISTPGQPRKTPVAKRDRVAMDADEDGDEDELGGFGVVGGIAPVRKSPRTGAARVPASERTLRTTRSTTNARKVTGATATATSTAAGTKAAGTGPPPHKIPRLAANSSTKVTTASAPRRRPPPGSPTGTAPSRLPTLVNRRALAPTPTLPNLRSQAPPAPDAWMNKDPSAVVVPGSKSERPLLRSVRRRRSSFSSADVVA